MSDAKGTWRVTDSSGTVSFAPTPGVFGTATRTYAITDSMGNTATGTITVAIDPSGVVYNSTSRVPVAGATVTLLFNGGNANAFVVGGNATQDTNAAGQYAFFLIPGAPAGTYSLTVSSVGYTFPSAAIPPSEVGVPAARVRQSWAHPTGDPTTYYLSGPLPVVDVINNNIPLVRTDPGRADPDVVRVMMLILAGLLLLFGFAAMRRQTM